MSPRPPSERKRLPPGAGLPLAAAALLVASLPACGAGEPPLVDPGRSTRGGLNEPPAYHPPDAGPRWEHADDLDGWKRAGKGAFPARGHLGGGYDAQIATNEPAAAPFAALSRATVMSAGAIVVELHVDRATGAPGPVFAMVKREAGFDPKGGDWEYVVTRADGVLEARGGLPLCARCHAESPTDRLFELPANAR